MNDIVRITDGTEISTKFHRLRQSFIFTTILDERDRQDAKWGYQDYSWPIWMTVLGEEVGEANEAVLKTIFGNPSHIKELEEELVQVAAVTVKILERIRIGRGE